MSRSYNKEPYFIRRQLTEGAVRAADKRAQFVGIEAYEAAGGIIMRDLFEDDDGGWLQDPALLDRLVAEKLAARPRRCAREGWKWIEAAVDFPYGHNSGLRRLAGESRRSPTRSKRRCDALRAEFDELEAEYAGADELPDEVDARLGEIEAALEAFDERPAIYDPADDRPRRRLRQRRCRRRSARRARLCPPRGRSRRPSPRATYRPRNATMASVPPARQHAATIAARASADADAAGRPRTTTASSRCRIGSSPS